MTLTKHGLKKIKSISEAHLRDEEAYLRKRRTSNEINTTESPEPFVTEIYQQRAAQTNVTEINTNKKNTVNNPIETESQSQSNTNNNSKNLESNVHPPRKKYNLRS